MRASLSLVVSLSSCFAAVSALPHMRVDRRAPTDQPKYSVIPLEPDRGDGGNGGGSGGGSGNGGGKGNDGDDVVTVIRTVIPEPKTRTLVEPVTVTKAVPTTISVIDVKEPATKIITVYPEPPAQTQSSTLEQSVTEAIPIPESSSVPLPSTTVLPSTTMLPSTTELPSATVPQVSEPAEGTAAVTYTLLPVPVSQPVSSAPSPISTTVEAPASTELALTSESVMVPSTYAQHASTVIAEPQPSSEDATPIVSPPTVVAPSTFITSVPTTPVPAPGLPATYQNFDNGQWHTTYPAWNETIASNV